MRDDSPCTVDFSPPEPRAALLGLGTSECTQDVVGTYGTGVTGVALGCYLCFRDSTLVTCLRRAAMRSWALVGGIE